jgi:hypothetical protein
MPPCRGIHWPDVGVEGLLLGKRSTESPASFQRWLRQRSAAGKRRIVRQVPGRRLNVAWQLLAK